MYKVRNNINSGISSLDSNNRVFVSVDCVIFGYDEKDLKVLLMDCDMENYKDKLSLLGDLVNPEESFDSAVHRVLKECTGLDDLYMEEVKSFSAVDLHPLGRVVSLAYYALVQTEDFVFDDPANKHLQWVSISELKDLAFDHNKILNVCLKRMKKRLRERPIGFRLLPEKFTLQQLQSLYEVVLDIQLDKRNFRRKIKSLAVLEDLNEIQQSVAHRPGKLYSFNKEEYLAKRTKGFKFEM